MAFGVVGLVMGIKAMSQREKYSEAFLFLGAIMTALFTAFGIFLLPLLLIFLLARSVFGKEKNPLTPHENP